MSKTLCLLTSEDRGLCSASAPGQLLDSPPPDLQQRSFSPFVHRDSFTLWSGEGLGEQGRIIITGECKSTLDLAWALVRCGLFRPGDWLFARSQWGGRGQYGRAWVSPPGNLYASLAVDRWKGKMAVSVLAGVILASCLREMGLEVRIKWPNDLLCLGRKLGGLLVEQRDGLSMLGIGLNVRSAPGRTVLRSPESLSATCLQEVLPGIRVGAIGLGLRLVSCFDLWYARLAELSSEEVRSHCERYLAFLGEDVRVEQGRKVFRAKVAGLDLQGRLLVDAGQGLLSLSAGSVFPCQD